MAAISQDQGSKKYRIHFRYGTKQFPKSLKMIDLTEAETHSNAGTAELGMHSNIFWAAAAGLLAVCPANGGDPPKVDRDAAKLVQDLGSPRFAVREIGRAHV